MSDSAFEIHQAARLAQFDQFVAEARALYDVRNRQYKDSARTLGVIGVLYEMNGIAGRVRALRDAYLRAQFSPWEEGEAKADIQAALRDKLLDAINYAVMALMMIEDGNILGE